MMCAKTDEEKRDMEKVPYSSVVGSLLYLSTGTRPDIAYAVGEVSRFMKNPGRGHWTAVKHLLRYLKGTVDWGIQFGGPGADLTVQGYSDADWGGAQDRRSTTGYVFMLAGGPVSWRSKRQKSVALSTMEAEYMSLCDAAQEAIWMARLMVDLIGQAAVPKAIVIHEDNQGCREYAKNHVLHGRAKHIDIRYHFIREKVAEGAIEVVECAGVNMLADILTKPVKRDQFQELAGRMGMTA